MHAFSSMRVAVRLSLGFGLVVLLMLLSGSLAYYSLHTVAKGMDNIVDDKVPKLEWIADINHNVLDIARSLRNALLEIDTPEKRDRQIENVLAARGRITATLAKLEPKIQRPEGKAIMQRILDARTAFIDGQNTVIALIRQNKPAEAKEFLLTEMRQRQTVYAQATAELQVLQRKLMAEASDEARKEVSQAGILLFAAVAANALLAALIAWWIIRDLSRQLGGEPSYAAENVRLIAAGDLSQPIRAAHPDSLLGSLQSMQQSLSGLVAEIRQMVAASARGDFSGRIRLEGKQGFGRDIGESLNQLAETTQDGLDDVMRISQALARGDLSQKIETARPGVFGQTGNAVNATVDALTRIVNEIDRMVLAATRGDFSLRIELHDKQGFAAELGTLLNQLAETTETGLQDVMRVANTLSNGDLTARVDKDYPGLFGDLAGAINTTVDRLSELVTRIKEAVTTINTAASEIASGNQDLSSRTEEQASSLEETASSMEELAATVRNNTGSARRASREATAATEVAERGGQIVQDSVSVMSEIAASSTRIADIISVIDSIAFQTNILALNAAVEAARAGEQGRGFAVVATEVRNLARRSADAAREIKQLISESVTRIEAGNAQAASAGQQMREIVHAIGRVSGLIGEIAHASAEQSSGIEQVSQAVSQMDEVTQQNAALVEQAAAAAESLHDQARQLADAVAAFKLANTDYLPATPRALSGPQGELAPAARAKLVLLK